MIKIKVFAVNPFREATYVVSDQTKEALVIDAGFYTQLERDRFESYIEKNGLKPVMAVNTHCHIDHILGVQYLKETYGIPFAASRADLDLLQNIDQSFAAMFGIEVSTPLVREIDIDLSEQPQITFGATTLQAIPTPGHTPGGVVLFDAKDGILFTGDTLFKGSIGRTDLPGGDYADLMDSILTQIVPLGKEITIYPGHGDHTTLSDELTHNPFITEVLREEVHYK